MYKSRHSQSFPRVRGGFSLFPTGTPQGVSGLGDDTLDPNLVGNYNYTDPFAPAGSSTNPSGSQLTVSNNFLSNIPTSAWIWIGVSMVALVAFSKK